MSSDKPFKDDKPKEEPPVKGLAKELPKDDKHKHHHNQDNPLDPEQEI
jgi:hypothetical protein